MQILDKRQDDLDDQCTVYFIKALVSTPFNVNFSPHLTQQIDLIEAICPAPSPSVRNITNILRSETTIQPRELPPRLATGSSSPPTASPSTPEDHVPSSDVSLGSLGLDDGSTADNRSTSEMAMGIDQVRGEVSSDFPMAGADFDAMLRQSQPQQDNQSPQSAFLNLFNLLDPGSEWLPELENTALGRPPQGIADVSEQPHSPSAPPDWRMDTELNDTGQAASPTFGTGAEMLSLSDIVDTCLKDSVPTTSSANRQTNTDDGNVTSQPDPQLFPTNSALDTDMDMSDLSFLFPDLVDESSNHSLLPMPTPDPVCRWPANDQAGENIITQPGTLLSPAHSALSTSVNMSDQLFFPDIADSHPNHTPVQLVSDQVGRGPVDGEYSENVPIQSEILLSPAYSPVRDPVIGFDSDITSDNGESASISNLPDPETHGSPRATSQALDKIQLAISEHNLQGLPINSISSTASFKFSWGCMDGTVVKAVFEQLSSPGSAIADDAIDYFSRRLASSRLWIGRWSQKDQLQLSDRCILIVPGDTTEWSLIEAQPEATTITHYTCSSRDSITTRGHECCSYCLGTIDAVNRLRRNPTNASNWIFQAEAVANQPGCDGLLLLWNMELRAEEKDLRSPIPPNYRMSLVNEFFAGLKAAYSSYCLLQENMPRNPSRGHSISENLEKYWVDYGNRHGYGLRLWERVQELASSTGKTTSKASDLLFMALTIASPESLIKLRGCVEQVRSQLRGTNHSYEESPRGVFKAVNHHCRSDDLSKVGSRIGHFKLHKLKNEYKDGLEQVLSVESESEHERLQEFLKPSNKGLRWSHIVEHAAGENPNILCLLPPAQTGPTGTRIVATHYRDLSIPDCKMLRKLLEEFRPGVISSIHANLSTVLLHVKDPLGTYPLEQFSNMEIKEQKLSSSFYCEALVLKGRD